MASKLRDTAKLFLPPIITRSLARVRRTASDVSFEYMPAGWNASESIAEYAGWNVENVALAERAKWNAFKHRLAGSGPLGFSHEDADSSVTRNVYFHNIHLTFAYVVALAARQKPTLSILDWGGGLGHYYLLAKALLPGVGLDFHCREVPVMCQHGKELCPEVNFYSDDRCLERKYDLAIMNGSLGYLPDWQKTVTRIAGSVAEYFLLTRVFVVERAPTFVILHRTKPYGYDSNMLLQVFNKNEIFRVTEKAGLHLEREFVVGPGPFIAGAPEQCEDSGWLFKTLQ